MRRRVFHVLTAGVVAAVLATACGNTGPHGSFYDPDSSVDKADAPPQGPGFDFDSGRFSNDGGTVRPGCGNGSKDLNEQCDDGNTMAGDGCGAGCKSEPGYTCSRPGAACTATACGDGLRAGDEDCDDGNSVSGDGCGATCTLELGFACPVAGAACVPTTCGDAKREGSEQCDDGNLRPYDGCSPSCTLEPVCANGTCMALCGDGIKFPGEPCDDGNQHSGDGCSASCQLEAGFTCEVIAAALPGTLDIPVILRDFDDTHPDFEHWCCGNVKGMVQPTLDAQKKPVLANVGTPQLITSPSSFAEWYTDAVSVNSVVLDKLTFNKQSDDSYLFDTSSFFPLDNKGRGNQGRNHNFHFTSELRYWFTYQGGEVLDFRGDDDVFVFINGKLAVDIGGVHPASQASVTLDASTAAQLGLTIGGMYEFVVFQAERHTSESNYRLTLRGFVHGKTSCKSVCGDGIKTKDEACDDGTNAGGYGACAPGCVLGPRCGDGVVDGDHGEQCDDGNLLGADGCSATCAPDAPN